MSWECLFPRCSSKLALDTPQTSKTDSENVKVAPFIGGFITMNGHLGWRWTEYIVAMMGFLALGLNLLFLEETYPPIVLVQKASELRRRTLVRISSTHYIFVQAN